MKRRRSAGAAVQAPSAGRRGVGRSLGRHWDGRLTLGADRPDNYAISHSSPSDPRSVSIFGPVSVIRASCLFPSKRSPTSQVSD